MPLTSDFPGSASSGPARRSRRLIATGLGVLALLGQGTPAAAQSLRSVSAGDFHTCVTRDNGRSFCWGRNDSGQVGAGGGTPCNGPPSSPGYCLTSPRYVITASQLDAGADHTCAVDTVGRPWCWGQNVYGQTGIPYYSRVNTPTPLPTNLSFHSISAGSGSTCGMAGSTPYCWGQVFNSVKPLSAAGFGWPPQQVAAGDGTLCTLFTGWGTTWELGQISCYGNNRFGQAAIDPVASPRVWITDFNLFDYTVKRVVMQAETTCAEMANGTVMCAGYNGWGVLGNGSWTSTHVPQFVGNGMPLHGLSLGRSHACALDSMNRAWCWGSGYYGELGQGGSGGSSNTPVLVDGGRRTFLAVTAGQNHSCGISSDNRLFCWGNNSWGQLGLGYLGFWGSRGASLPQEIYNPPQ